MDSHLGTERLKYSETMTSFNVVTPDGKYGLISSTSFTTANSSTSIPLSATVASASRKTLRPASAILYTRALAG